MEAGSHPFLTIDPLAVGSFSNVHRVAMMTTVGARFPCWWGAEGLASGVNFYRLQAGEFVETKKLVLLK